MDLSLSGKVGLRAVAYYMTTTVLAVILGIILVVIIKPGAGGIKEKDLPHEDTKRNVTTADTLMDLVRWAEKDQILGKIDFLFIQKLLPAQHYPSCSQTVQNRAGLSG